ncbi:hypothetical protein [Corynebacterium argentoratense]|uniref:hypothetical protein n=1 Tax=Corynebacterium argentoratense TaxID=42817 RepID=UPI001F3E80A7|nr:hypothetical protein [Corynebacterium argentoratense]MCF1694327.1 hypothetical protein [Corynebacterium argentoratense]MCF1694329.1 hypothetical protein [Corynebacterium argentoratense]MCF1735898.1 hypothetical protein [Corynebacterium argentoratense]MCF1735900.1 hypothetical protein [Corynebacterium argentoratense]
MNAVIDFLTKLTSYSVEGGTDFFKTVNFADIARFLAPFGKVAEGSKDLLGLVK